MPSILRAFTLILSGKRLLFKIYEITRRDIDENGFTCNTCYSHLIIIENLEYDLRMKSDSNLKVIRSKTTNQIDQNINDRKEALDNSFMEDFKEPPKELADHQISFEDEIMDIVQDKHEEDNCNEGSEEINSPSYLNQSYEEDDGNSEYEEDDHFEQLQSIVGTIYLHEERELKKMKTFAFTNKVILSCQGAGCQFRGKIENNRLFRKSSTEHSCEKQSRNVALSKLLKQLEINCVERMDLPLNDIYEKAIELYPYKEDLKKSFLLNVMWKCRSKKKRQDNPKVASPKRSEEEIHKANTSFELLTSERGSNLYLYEGFLFQVSTKKKKDTVQVVCSFYSIGKICKASATIKDNKFLMKLTSFHTCVNDPNYKSTLEKRKFKIFVNKLAIEEPNLSPEGVINTVLQNHKLEVEKLLSKEEMIALVEGIRKRLLSGTEGYLVNCGKTLNQEFISKEKSIKLEQNYMQETDTESLDLQGTNNANENNDDSYEKDSDFQILELNGPIYIHKERELRSLNLKLFDGNVLVCKEKSCNFKGKLDKDIFYKKIGIEHTCSSKEKAVHLIKLKVQLVESCLENTKRSLNEIYENETLLFPYKEELNKPNLLILMRKFRMKKTGNEKRQLNQISANCDTFYADTNFEEVLNPKPRNKGCTIYIHNGFYFRIQTRDKDAGVVYMVCRDTTCPAKGMVNKNKFWMKTLFKHTCLKNEEGFLKIEKEVLQIRLHRLAIEQPNLAAENVVKKVWKTNKFKIYTNISKEDRDIMGKFVKNVRTRLDKNTHALINQRSIIPEQMAKLDKPIQKFSFPEMFTAFS